MKSLWIILLLCTTTAQAINVDELQQRIAQGKAEDARNILTLQLKSDPKNPRLLYNRAVASYAAGKFDEALVDLDLVEDLGEKPLQQKARFQRGNAQFRLGATTLTTDVELTLARWRQSLDEFRELIRTGPNHSEARTNYAYVRKRFMEVLMKRAAADLQTAQKTSTMEKKITNARASMEQFHEASTLEPENQPAKQGEDAARELLANSLTQEGERKTMSTNLVNAARNEPPGLRPDTAQIEEGVNMLQDAQNLKPNDPSIAEKLERGKDRLADALTTQAQNYANLEPRVPRIDEKLGILRMAMETVEKALAERPNHERAQQALEQVKRRLAEIHEMEGDRQEQIAQKASLEQQAQNLSNALDHFQQASALQPQQAQLPQKAQHAQSQLEQALEKLGDRLMKSPGQESLDQQVMRMEGAAQAFNELEGLKPTPQISEKARAASEALEKLRQQLAQSGKPEQPGQPQPGLAQLPPQDGNEGAPMDAPPRLDKKGRNTRYQSGQMNRSLRDY